MLDTQTDRLHAPAAKARNKGLPYDPKRLELFEALRAELHRTPPRTLPAVPGDVSTLPFFEAYFSNFIEGTEFAVDVAAAIVFKNRIPKARPEDAHDILGTYRLVVEAAGMAQVPHDVHGNGDPSVLGRQWSRGARHDECRTVTAGEQRIIIRTIYRANYLSALKAISNGTSPEPLIRMLDFAQRFTRMIDWTSFAGAEAELKAAHAFMDSAEAEDRGIRLRLPK